MDGATMAAANGMVRLAMDVLLPWALGIYLYWRGYNMIQSPSSVSAGLCSRLRAALLRRMRVEEAAKPREADLLRAERIRLKGIAYIGASALAMAAGTLGILRILGFVDIVWYK